MPGGIWDTKDYLMNAQIRKDGRLIKESPLQYLNQPSRFTIPLEITGQGAYEVTVSVFEPRNGNSGLATTTFIVK
jgi:hypothetical protein